MWIIARDLGICWYICFVFKLFNHFTLFIFHDFVCNYWAKLLCGEFLVHSIHASYRSHPSKCAFSTCFDCFCSYMELSSFIKWLIFYPFTALFFMLIVQTTKFSLNFISLTSHPFLVSFCFKFNFFHKQNKANSLDVVIYTSVEFKFYLVIIVLKHAHSILARMFSSKVWFYMIHTWFVMINWHGHLYYNGVGYTTLHIAWPHGELNPQPFSMDASPKILSHMVHAWFFVIDWHGHLYYISGVAYIKPNM